MLKKYFLGICIFVIKSREIIMQKAKSVLDHCCLEKNGYVNNIYILKYKPDAWMKKEILKDITCGVIYSIQTVWDLNGL